MKFIIVQGDDTDRSYKRLETFVTEAKRREWEIIYDDPNLTPSLFGKQRLLVIRDPKLLNKKNINALQTIDGTLIVYSEGNFPISVSKLFPKEAKIEKFDLPKKLWSFLDNMTVKGLHELIKTEAIEFVFAMIAWKLKKKFMANPSQKTVDLIGKLSDIDYDVKTGKGDLLSLLDLFILKHLE